MEEILLDLKNVRKQYANFSMECSMKVKRGHITGLIGDDHFQSVTWIDPYRRR